MPLINCGECGHQISSEALSCPNCGYPQIKTNPKYRKKRKILLIACTILLIAALPIGYNQYLKYKNNQIFEAAITTDNYEDVLKYINIIEAPKQLKQIAARCSKVAELLFSQYKSEENWDRKINTFKLYLQWASANLEALKRHDRIVYGQVALDHQNAMSLVTRISSAVLSYSRDNGNCPDSKQGLDALKQIPTVGIIPKKWNQGGYVPPEENFVDPWGNKLIYKSPGCRSEKDFEIISYGADGKPGGEGFNADISSCE
jgi:type II secretion system protein G